MQSARINRGKLIADLSHSCFVSFCFRLDDNHNEEMIAPVERNQTEAMRRMMKNKLPKDLRWSAGPIPLSMRICGLPIAPADSTTSLRATMAYILSLRWRRTP